MSAHRALGAARTAGISLRVEGDDLLLDAPEAPPPAVLEMLLRHKAGVLALLRTGNDWSDGPESQPETARGRESARADAGAERAAIMEIDGGLSRDWAEALADILAGPYPQGCSKRVWAQLCDDVLRFADDYGEMLARLGWSFQEVFGLPSHWFRLDQRGAAWFVRGRSIVRADADMITIECNGGRSTLHRAGAKEHQGDVSCRAARGPSKT